jgi:hypothetical protein
LPVRSEGSFLRHVLGDDPLLEDSVCQR